MHTMALVAPTPAKQGHAQQEAPVARTFVARPYKWTAETNEPACKPAPEPVRSTRFVIPWRDELTEIEAPRLVSLVARRIDRSGCDVTVDLSECPHMDEDGAQALLALRDFAIRRGHALRVVTAPGTRPAAKIATYRIRDLFA